MKRWMLVAVAAALAALAGCEKKKDGPTAVAGGDAAPGTAKVGTDGKEQPPGTAIIPPTTPAATDVKAKFADTTSIWAYAPADATFGVVVADGVGTKAIDLLSMQLKRMEGKPFAKKALADLERWRKEQPFDFFDPAAYKAKGIDLTKGVAAFGGADTSKPGLLILPAGDLATFRTTLKATTEKVGDREVDKVDEIVCTTVGTRYACAPTLEAIDAAMKPHDSPLATAVKALPGEARGDAEGYIDISKMPKVAEELNDVKPVGDFTAAGGALRIDATAFNMHAWAKGAMSPIALMMASTAPPADLANMTANATTVVRAKVEPKLLLGQAPGSMPIGDADVRTDLLDQLTGDIQLVTAGKGLMAGAIMLKVLDTAKVKKVVAAVCVEAKKPGALPVSNIVAKEDSCSGEVSLAQLKEMIGIDLPPFKFNFVVTGNILALALGDLDLASLKGTAVDAVGSPEAREALAGAQTVVLWSRGLNLDASGLPKDLADKALSQPQVADALAMMNFSMAHIYDLSLAASLDKNGVKATLHMSTIETDPADAKTAYFAAIDKQLAGDRAGYLAAMADVEKKFPGSLAARRAALERVGSPTVGPVGAMIVGGAFGAFMFAKLAGESIGKATAPGFGEPVPVEPPTENKPDEKPADVKPDEKPADVKPDEKPPEPKAEEKPTEPKPPEAPKAPEPPKPE